VFQAPAEKNPATVLSANATTAAESDVATRQQH